MDQDAAQLCMAYMLLMVLKRSMSHIVVSFQLQGRNVVAPRTVMFHLVEFVKSFGPVIQETWPKKNSN